MVRFVRNNGIQLGEPDFRVCMACLRNSDLRANMRDDPNFGVKQPRLDSKSEDQVKLRSSDYGCSLYWNCQNPLTEEAFHLSQH